MVGYQEFQKLVGAHACIGVNVAPPLPEHIFLVRFEIFATKKILSIKKCRDFDHQNSFSLSTGSYLILVMDFNIPENFFEIF
jgi:hypothetical protein